MTTPKHTVIFVLDRSGSMENKLEATLESFNGYLAKLKESPEIEFTLIQFDTISTDILHRRKPIGQVGDLTREVYSPRAGTPLIDAACVAIDAAKQDYAKTDKVVITIMTDGQENSSREYKMADLHDRIKECSAHGWQFIFLGASVDNYAEGGRMGIKAGSTMSYNARDLGATKSAYGATAQSTRDYFDSGQAVNFSETAKNEAGDVYAKNHEGNLGEGSGGDKAKTLVDKVKL